MYRAAYAVALLLAGGLLAGCSDDSAGDDSAQPDDTSTSPSAATVEAADLDGTTYTSTSVEGHDLVPGTAIDLGFEDGSMSVSAGCNTMFGPYAVTEGVLAWDAEPAMTMIGCADDLAEQDQWLTELFSAGLAATSAGSSLTLTGGDVTIELSSGSGEDLTGVLGRSWTGVGTISGGTTSRLPVRTARPTLSVADDGLARLFTGCHSGRTTVRVEGETLSFANTRVTSGTCKGPARLTEETVLEVLDGASDAVTFNGKVLVIEKGDTGLVFQVR